MAAIEIPHLRKLLAPFTSLERITDGTSVEAIIRSLIDKWDRLRNRVVALESALLEYGGIVRATLATAGVKWVDIGAKQFTLEVQTSSLPEGFVCSTYEDIQVLVFANVRDHHIMGLTDAIVFYVAARLDENTPAQSAQMFSNLTNCSVTHALQAVEVIRNFGLEAEPRW